MKFVVSRTSSSYDNDNPPCDDSFKEKYTRLEIRTLSNFEAFDAKFGDREGRWLSKGNNHCISKEGYIQREIPEGSEDWFIDIHNLDELMAFNERYGDIILTKAYSNREVSRLEIYDDYRE